MTPSTVPSPDSLQKGIDVPKLEILFALALIACVQQARGADEPLQLSMVIYSGRKDPSWKAAEEDVKEFTARFDELKTKDAKELPPGALGYRGFMVTGFRSYHRIRVWNGTVEATGDIETFRWADKDRALEKYLLETSKGHVSDREYKTAAADIEKK